MIAACLAAVTIGCGAVAFTPDEEPVSSLEMGQRDRFWPKGDGADLRKVDDTHINWHLARGKKPQEIIAERVQAGDRQARCVDTARLVDDTCPFADASGQLKGEQAAAKRVDAAISRCTEYPQTTANFCLGKLSQAVESELAGVYKQSLAMSRKADAAKSAECKAGEAFACGGGMDHAKSLAASQLGWSSYVDNQCTYQTEANVGGSGYASFGAICWLELAAARIDQLAATKPYAVEAAE